MLPNKSCFVVLLFAFLLSFSLVACNEEESENTSGFRDNASIARNADEDMDVANDENRENDGKSDAVANKGCTMQLVPESVHRSADGVIHAISVPDTIKGCGLSHTTT